MVTTKPRNDVPFDRATVEAVLRDLKVDPGVASIREMVLVVGEIEKRLKVRFLRMEFGIPGLDPDPAGARAEAEAMANPRTAATYPPVYGLPVLKSAGARFLKLFLDVDVPPERVIPTVGSMQGGFLSQAVAGRRDAKKDAILFVDPCFSVHRMQCRFLGLRDVSVDLYDRKSWLDRVEAAFETGTVGGILYSTPNNPTWNILNDAELGRLGKLCAKHDVVAIEDSAYFGMDFRRDYSKPGKPPYPPTVARHTDNWVLLLSGAKIFSYAGQRVAIAALSPKLSERRFPGLARHFGYERFYDALVMSGLYCNTSGVTVSAQIGLAALLDAASDGKLRFLETTREYADRARFFRKVMTGNGFRLVYDTDLDEPLSDGFYFTFAYPGMDGGDLAKELLCYGISCTTLRIARSERTEGLRACVSLIGKPDFDLFEARIRAFRRDHR